VVLTVVRAPLVLLSGGGTVGHLAPGFALAEALEAQGVRTRFATPGGEDERAWFPEDAPAPLTIPALRRGSLPGLPLMPARLAGCVARAAAVLDRVAPDVVVALGGWPCVPSALAAVARRVPLAFVASDEVPGVVVRWLAPFARRIYVASPDAARALPGGARVRVVGPLLRRALLEGRHDPERFGLHPDRRTLFVTGGSLGSRALNLRAAEGMLAAVTEDPSLRGRVQVLHSVGRSGEGVAERYARAGVAHRVTPFLRDMGTAWRTADLALCRAGAVTCAELEATGTPAVLVPYPHHADRQQYANAERLVARGAAAIVEEDALDPDRFRRDVLSVLLDDRRREDMALRMSAGFRDGAGKTAADLIRFLRWGAQDRGASRSGLAGRPPPGR
jgi:UDP-N-acetylglucosamine--N-acetylmuramyl-(pentapeptide) pyrophosphoryl-undecaprenol N-acetylglucosamine transferase